MKLSPDQIAGALTHGNSGIADCQAMLSFLGRLQALIDTNWTYTDPNGVIITYGPQAQAWMWEQYDFFYTQIANDFAGVTVPSTSDQPSQQVSVTTP